MTKSSFLLLALLVAVAVATAGKLAELLNLAPHWSARPPDCVEGFTHNTTFKLPARILGDIAADSTREAPVASSVDRHQALQKKNICQRFH